MNKVLQIASLRVRFVSVPLEAVASLHASKGIQLNTHYFLAKQLYIHVYVMYIS
jgi:hypothetical protein